MKVFISGSLAYDRIMDFPGKFSDHILPDKVHILNVCFTVNGLTEKFGGTAGNIAYTLTLLGESPTILATLGRDNKGYEARLDELGLSREGVRLIPEALTAGAYITTDKSDNQITAFNLGAMAFPSLYDFDGVDPSGALAIMSPGNTEDMVTYSRRYKEIGLPYIFDPGQQIPVTPPELLAEMITGAKILISNDYELEMIGRATGWSQEEILERCGAVIVTLGERGSLVCTKDSEDRVPAIPVDKLCDPTGAGDAYRAGLIKGLVEGLPLGRAARLGAVTAAYAVEQYGTQEHCFTLEEFQARYDKHFG